MKSVWFSDDLSFEKKIPLDYHVTIGSAWHQWQIRFPLLKKTFEYTIYMQVNFLQRVYIQIDKIDMYYGVQLMFINAVRFGSKWTLLLVVEAISWCCWRNALKAGHYCCGLVMTSAGWICYSSKLTNRET